MSADTIRVLIAAGFFMLLLFLRLESERFGAAEYDEPERRRSVWTRLSWYLVGAILVGAVTCLSVIGLGMVVASFTRTVSQAFVVANFPMALMMFFSGVIYPMPKITVFTLGGYAIGLYDILPTTHAVAALNKILTLGASLNDVLFELTALTLLSVVYFVIGVWMFARFHLKS